LGGNAARMLGLSECNATGIEKVGQGRTELAKLWHIGGYSNVAGTPVNGEMELSAPECEHHEVLTNGIRLHVVVAGPPDGRLVILLHGFPEFWYGWRHQIKYLADCGYRVWAPDLRGYNLSAKPHGLDAYNLDILTRDVLGLIDAAGRDRAFAVGHDWGGAIAWWLAAKYPERLGRLVVINCPHGAVLRKHLRTNRTQQRRSWYMFFFQLPWIPELVVRRAQWRMLTRMMQGSARPGTFTDSELELYRKAWSQPGAFTAMLIWYRAMFRRPPSPPPRRPIAVPTLLIWGLRDRFLGREMVKPSIDLTADGRVALIEEATHWVHHEEPLKVNALIADFLGEEFK